MPIETLEPLLAEHPFLRGMSEDYLQLITGCAKNVKFEAGEVIFREGGDADRFYLIRHGRIALEVFTPERGSNPILSLGAGDVIGWSWLIPPYKWRFDARAIEQTRAIALDGKCLRGKCDDDPRLGYELLKRISAIIADRLHATRLQMLDVYGARY
jgi:CRP-like cAMP-binding protein